MTMLNSRMKTSIGYDGVFVCATRLLFGLSMCLEVQILNIICHVRDEILLCKMSWFFFAIATRSLLFVYYVLPLSKEV